MYYLIALQFLFFVYSVSKFIFAMTHARSSSDSNLRKGSQAFGDLTLNSKERGNVLSTTQCGKSERNVEEIM